MNRIPIPNIATSVITTTSSAITAQWDVSAEPIAEAAQEHRQEHAGGDEQQHLNDVPEQH